MRRPLTSLLLACLLTSSDGFAAPRELLWGDTHLHSNNSFDAYLNENWTADPDTAYRYAKGLPVLHPYHRARVQIGTPLDFLVVADHAELLGVIRHTVELGVPREGLDFWERIQASLAERWLRGVIEDRAGARAFASFLPEPGLSVEEAAARPPSISIPGIDAMTRSVWQEAIRIADAHNEPGHFSALIGWEWSSIPAGANLHRVVMTSANADTASRFHPWASSDSMYPEDLWHWLTETSERTGAEFVAIPHNSNISKGYMFAETSLRGEPWSAALAALRAHWEPVVEATQLKGDSETHPSVSPDDPFADFETYPFYIQNDPPPYAPKPGDFIRPALRLGLAIERDTGVNPFRFGLIGSTDAHTGIASAEEPNFWGKFPTDSVPERKQTSRPRRGGVNGWSMSASGLAAVWATENTRSAILEAFRRREVYATTGPRLVVHVFGGFDFEATDRDHPAEALRARGVPMGGELQRADDGAAPRFVIRAIKDPHSAHLDRVQIVKGWVDAEGITHERIHDVAWSGNRKPDAAGVLPSVGNTVDLATARYTNDIGAPQLASVWTDPDFDASEPAFYYVRVLEIPTPRHSLLDAVALRLDPSTLDIVPTIQERAYTSPIWYRP